MTKQLLAASTLIGEVVVDLDGRKLGHLRDVMIDISRGSVVFAILSREGGDGVPEKLFALPWLLLAVDGDEERLVVDVAEDVVDTSPGFEPGKWPPFDDMIWQESLNRHFDVVTCWTDPEVGVGI